jgi:hypothetical protein
MWIYNQKEINNISDFEETTIGFVYKITNIENNKIYIGKKILHNNTSKLLNKKEIEAWNKPGRVPKKKKEIKESNWKDYYGSSKTILEDIKVFGKDKFKREIIKFCTSKKQMSYWEVYYQFELKVLHIESYNDNIIGKFFRKDI